MIKGKNLSNYFWEKAISIVVYLKKKIPTTYLDLKTPFEALYGFKTTIHHLRVFGCKAFAHIPKENKMKLDAKDIKCIFVGYCSKFRAYKNFNPSTNKLLASRDVTFHEQADEGNMDNNYERWHILSEVEYIKDEAKDREQQKLEE